MAEVDSYVSIKSTDMPDDMLRDAITAAVQALELKEDDKPWENQIASHIKKEFDKTYRPSWHCIVGQNFGSYFTHENTNFVYFMIDDICILLWRSA